MCRYLTLIIVTFCLFNCQNEQKTLTEASSISELESNYEANPSGEHLQLLLDAYDRDSTGKYLKKKAELELSNNRFQQGLASLSALIQQEATPEKALDLAAAYEQSQNRDASNSAYQAFLLSYPNHAKTDEIQSKLPNDLPNLTQRLTQLYYSMSDSLQRVNPKKVNDYIASSEAAALIYPQTDSAAVHLKRAAESALSMRNFDRALNLYDLLMKKYPSTKESEQALFRTAFIHDNDLGEMEKAKEYYQQFISQYPNSEFADDSKFLLENLGKDDAEILESLLKKGQ